MRKLEKENRRKMRFSLKRTSKKIKLHQIELLTTELVREITASFHTSPENFGAIKEKISIPYSLSTRNMFY
jgi:hypothetical protein